MPWLTVDNRRRNQHFLLMTRIALKELVVQAGKCPPRVGNEIIVASLLLALSGLSQAAVEKLAADLESPVRLEAAGKPIDTAVGHAAPFVGDFDGDGVKELLVGQFGEGILWIYRNTGSNAKPQLAAGVKFKEGGKDGRVPTG